MVLPKKTWRRLLWASKLSSLAGDKAVVRQLLPLVKGSRHLIPVVVAMGVLCSALDSLVVGLALPILMRFLSGEAVADEGLNGWPGWLAGWVAGHSPAVLWCVVIALATLRSGFLSGYGVLSAHISNSIHHRTRSELFNRYMTLPYQELARMDYGTMTNALQVECWYVAEAVRAVCGMVISLCALVVFFGAMLFVSWPMGLLALALGIGMRYLVGILRQPLRKIGFQVTLMNEELALRMYTRMQGIRTIRAHGFEVAESNRFEAASKDLARAFSRMTLVENIIRPVSDVSALLVLVTLCGFSTMIGNPVVVTVTAVAVMYRLQPHLGRIDGAVMTLLKSQGSLAAVARHLSGPVMATSHDSVQPVPLDWRTLRGEEIGFSYDAEAVLDDLHFELSRGQVVAIRGPSGAGKSTLVNMILKLIQPTSGRLTLDGEDMLKIDRVQWLSRIAAAGQDFELMDGTLRENITLGRPLSDEIVLEALALAEIKVFVDKLPQGLQTRVGERGIRLSGGQRQRIVLARALAGSPDLLILDEAVSAVSIGLERRIYENILERRPDMTLVLVTHRELPEGMADVEIHV